MFKIKNKKLTHNNKYQKTLRSIKCFAGTDGMSFTCYSHKCLKKIANDWNNHLSLNIKLNKSFIGGENEDNEQNSKLDVGNIIDIENISKKELWNLLNNINKNYFNCSSEICWASLPYIRNKTYLLKRFRPPKPKSWYKDKNTWLNTTDIENVMYQYEKRFPDFKFLGVSPVDYDYEYQNECVSEDICRLKIKDLHIGGKKKFGIVFNLDRHNESGSHWVSLFSDLDKGEIYYYDSYGLRPPYDIRKLMKEISNQGQTIPQKDERQLSEHGQCLDNCDLKQNFFTSYFNNIRHQYKNSECGIYSMHFIISFLEGFSFSKIITNIKQDDEINKYRDVYYHSF